MCNYKPRPLSFFRIHSLLTADILLNLYYCIKRILSWLTVNWANLLSADLLLLVDTKRNTEGPVATTRNLGFCSAHADHSCNLDLSLATPTPSNHEYDEEITKKEQSNEDQQRAPIICNGKNICGPFSTSPQLLTPTGTSAMRSLRQFLERRRARIQSMNSPYYKQHNTTQGQWYILRSFCNMYYTDWNSFYQTSSCMPDYMPEVVSCH